MRPKVIVPLALVAIAVLGVAWFLSRYERVPIKVHVGPTGEARLNPFLAAERLARRMGGTARALRSLSELDSLGAGSVLLLPNERQALDRQRIEQLVGWVRDGGHLLAEAELPGVADPLLEVLGIERGAVEPLVEPVRVPMSDGGTLRVSFPGRTGLPAERTVAFPLGQGRITIVASLDFARNELIGEHDNAAFLWRLIEQARVDELIVFLQPRRLSLWRFALEHAPAALAAAAALLALWLWRIGPRFGPLEPDAPPARRRLLDHLRASGRYYWSCGHSGRLALVARDAAVRRLARAQPEFLGAPPADKAAHLAAVLGIPLHEARQFMAAGGKMRGSEFIRLVHTAQRLHSMLERGRQSGIDSRSREGQ